jgi:hypothetical protein
MDNRPSVDSLLWPEADTATSLQNLIAPHC